MKTPSSKDPQAQAETKHTPGDVRYPPSPWAATWHEVMAPMQHRVPLSEVADWYWQVRNWREVEAAAGRGTPYDFNPAYCVNRGMVLMKFPFLSIRDLVELVDETKRAERRNRGKVIRKAEGKQP